MSNFAFLVLLLKLIILLQFLFDLNYSTIFPGASELLQSLYRLSSSLQGNGHKDSDLMLIEGLIRNADFQNILTIHNKVQEVCCFKCPPSPITSDAQDMTQEVINVNSYFFLHRNSFFSCAVICYELCFELFLCQSILCFLV